MQTHKLFAFILTFSLSSFAANTAKKQTQRQPVNLAVSFETLGKNKELLNTVSFDGEQKTLLSGDVKNSTDFKCECSGQFEVLTLGVKQYIAAFLEFNCSSNSGQNDQKIKSKIGRILIPVKDYQSFFKVIFLHKDQPQAVLKIKELSL
ncbi:MAG: hypothetical protein NDI63_01410 [Pseudobdellovibrio sp.]|nr:hypothetical protein [Pseudobdellovibrio sp.]